MAPSLAPGIVTEYTESGTWLFRWRSYPPLAVLAFVLASVSLDPVPAGGVAWRAYWLAAGLLCGALGFGIRQWALGYVPPGTSGRGTEAPVADRLNTTGLYSVVRHPLYLGNYFLWIGVVVSVGRPGAALVTTLLFWLYYERIMMAEERFLHVQFGDHYARWTERTPAFVPRWRNWTPSTRAFSWRFCLGRDYQALYGFVAATTAAEVARSVAAGGGWIPTWAWIAWFAGGTTAYVVLHTLKRRTRLLEPTPAGPDEGLPDGVRPATAP